MDIAVLFAYDGGALWGMLLDDFGVVWRPYVEMYTDLGLFLAEFLGIDELMTWEELEQGQE